MSWQNNPYTLPFVLAALVMLPVAILSWRHRKTPGAEGLIGVALSAMWWSACSALQWASADIFAQLFWFKAHYLGTQGIAISVLFLGAHYTAQSYTLYRPRTLFAIFSIPLLIQIAIWTNEAHGLFLRRASQELSEGFSSLIVENGLMFYLHAVYSYAVFAIAIWILATGFFKARGLARWQLATIIISGIIPVITSLLFNLELLPFKHLDLTPIGAGATAIIMLISLSRFGMLDVVPTARDMILESLGDPFFVIDLRSRVIDLNAAARRLTLNPTRSPMGRRLTEVFPAWAQITDTQPDLNTWQEVEVTIGNLDERPDYAVRVSPLQNEEKNLIGYVIILRDITERKKAEETLKQSQVRFASVIEDIEDPYFETDLFGKIIFANKSLCDTLRYTSEELHSVDFRQTIAPADEKRIFGIFGTVYELAMPVKSVEYGFRRKDGITGVGEISLSLMRDATGQGMGFRGIIRDITERKEAERRLRASQALFEEVVENVPDAYYEVDLTGTLTYINKVFHEYLKATHQEVMGKSFRHLTTRVDARRLFEIFNEVYRTEQAQQQLEFMFRRTDGTLFAAELSVSLRYDSEQNKIGYRGFVRDVSPRKQAEEALRQSEEKYRTILEEIKDGYYEMDLAGNFTAINDAGLEMTGFNREEALGRNFSSLTDRKSALELAKVYNQVYQTGEAAKDIEYEMIVKDGSHKIFEVSASLIRNSEQKGIGFRGIMRDVTQRKQAEQELRKAKDDAEAANKAKSAFLNTVSHELRTPLTSVLGFAKLIRKRFSEAIVPALPMQERKAQRAIDQVNTNIDIIIAEGERLTALINNVLDLAKIESGKVEWKEEPIVLNDIVERAAAATASLFEQKPVELVLAIENNLPNIVGDQDRLIQVVINLISNAVKFTPQGSVTCTAKRQANEIIISVKDTGIGIAPENHHKVFEQFTQVGDTLTDKPQGTGLGLPICKEIVEHHQGRIWVESELGQGCTFSFTLPLPKTERASQMRLRSTQLNTLVQQLKTQIQVHAVAPEPNRKKKVLIVDDEVNVRELLRQEMELDGYEVCEAQDGREALAKVKSECPDLILLDVMMPELNGFDVAAVLRNDPQTLNIPIIILSVMHDQERGYRIGVDRYFTKPVEAELLMNEVSALLNRGTRKKVLLIEESPETIELISQPLSAQGYVLSVAHTGSEGLQKAASEQPDVIILNTNMTEREQLIKDLRATKGLESVSLMLFH